MASTSVSEKLWQARARSCFQDRLMPYAYWIEAVIDRQHHEHRKVLAQSVAMLTGGDFVRLLGERQFARLWQALREDVVDEPTAVRQGRIILDGLWSAIMTGFAFSHPGFKLDKPMSTELKATYLAICQHAVRSIYQVARDVNRPYNRIYGDVKKLQSAGLVKALSSVQAGRKVTLWSVA